MKRLLLAVLLTVLAAPGLSAREWKENPYSGGEKLFFRENDIQAMRDKIDRYPWAEAVFEKLRVRAEGPVHYYPLSKGIRPEMVRMKDIALYWRISGDESNLGELRDTLIRYFKLDKPSEPLERPAKMDPFKIWDRMMRYDMRLLPAYDLVRNHPLMLPYKETMEARILEMTSLLKELVPRTRSGSNTTFWNFATLMTYGCMCGDTEAMDIAVNGKYGFKSVLGTFRVGGRFRPEGATYSYMYVDNCLLIIAELARLHGWKEDLYRWQHPDSRASIEKMALAMTDLATSDGAIVNCGDFSENADPGDGSFSLEKVALFGHPDIHRLSDKTELYYKVFRNPRFAWIISRNPRRDIPCDQFWGYLSLTHGVETIGPAEAPEAVSEVLPGMGYAILRSVKGTEYWGSEAPTVLLRSGERHLNHHHSDWFNLVVNAFGKDLYHDWFLYWDYLCPRPGRQNYTPISRLAINHNTVTVDCRDPRKDEPGEHSYSEISESGEMQRISVEGSIYEGVRQKRTVCLTKEYIIDIFELASRDEHTYDYALHSKGSSSFSGLGPWSPRPDLDKEYGLGPIDKRKTQKRFNKWMREPEEASCKGKDFTVSFSEGDGIGIRTTMLSAKGSTVFRTGTPFFVNIGGWDKTSNVGMPERNPMAIVRKTGRNAEFIAVHEPYKGAPSVSAKLRGRRIIISGPGFTDTYDTVSGSYVRVKK